MNSILNASLGYGSPQSAPAPAKAPQSGTGDAGTHLSAALAAHKKGNHHGAKKHALKAVNMLHRLSQQAPSAPPPADPSAPPAVAAP